MTDQDKNKHGIEDGETKTFTAVGDAVDETKTFSLGDGTGGPVEKSEERGAMRDFTPASLAWRILRPLLILAISAGLVIWIGVSGYHYVEENYFLPVDATAVETESVTIKPGSSLSTIASLLYDMGIVRNKLVFQMYVDLNDMGSSLVAGTYDLSPSMTMEQIMGILAEGDGGRETLTITLTEGMTAVDMADSLLKNEVLNKDERDEFLALCNDAEAYSDDYSFIAALADTERVDERNYLLEGYLFPDTYEIYADATPDDIIRKLLDRFDVIMTLEYEDRAETLGMTVDQVVTLASIIEWEALPKDYSKVSAVFFNRLDDGTPLGSCATLRYVTGEKKFVYTAEERDIDSPFNTYKYAGLPIGPVSNPGKKAIESALYPDEEYIEQGFEYFCTADPETGDLAFAKTLDEHNDNVAMYEDLW